MKRLIIIFALTFTFLGVKAQDKIDSTLAGQFLELADGVVGFDTIDYRPILIADSIQNYYVTMNEVAIKFDKAMILMWNEKGERVRLWLRKAELPEMEMKIKHKKTKLPYKVKKKKTRLPYKENKIK